MPIIALLTWLLTAVGGFVMLGMWLSRGGVRAGQAGAATGAGTAGGTTGTGLPTRLVPALIFGHFLLAAVGLVVWIAYVVTDTESLVWIALVLLVLVAVLGDVMFFRWLGGVRRRESTIETGFPKPLVYGHGVFAVITVVLVLLIGLGVGS